MKYIIILDMANNHRNNIIAPLCDTLANGNNDVILIAEKKIAFKFEDAGVIQLWDNSERIKFMLDKFSSITTIQLNSFKGESENKIDSANKARAKAIRNVVEKELPDKIIIWNGNYDYQRDVRQTLLDIGYKNKVLYLEVAWFSQKEFIYFDEQGVNAQSSIKNYEYIPLLPTQKIRLDLWKERYITKRFGNVFPKTVKKRIFVPLQVDTDTNIKLFSPFQNMGEFITFLETWIPMDYEVILKLHPKAKYNYPLISNRRNFKILASGNIDEYLQTSDLIIGINSTVLLEAVALNKKVIAFGEYFFPDTVVIKANKSDIFETTIQNNIVPFIQDSFLYELVFKRQVSIEELKKNNVAHLYSRHPFYNNEVIEKYKYENFHLNVKEGKIMIQIGKSKVAKTAYIDVEKEGNVKIGDDSEIRHHAVLEVSGRYNGSIEIGDHCVIGIGNWLQGSGEIKIGNDVIIGPYCSIISTNHMYDDIEKPIARQPLQTGKVVIEDDVWIGAHVTVTQNVTIGAHSIIGANSFVNKDVPPYSIVAGTPAKVIKMRK